MTLLAPLALWGLLALAVPLLLHLRRRRVGRTIQVGSLKHLETLPTAERRGPRVRDPLRLLLRLAILTLVVLSLGRPVRTGQVAAARPLVLADSGASPRLRDSLLPLGELAFVDLSAPWDAVARIDDSLPVGRPLLVVATTSSDRFSGPRPAVRRSVTWIEAPPPPRVVGGVRPGAVPPTAEERRALEAAVAAVSELLGAPADTAGWEIRLPPWWRDSLDAAAFPIAVARALFPAQARPAPTRLTVDQVLPIDRERSRDATRVGDLHWWIWGLAALLFLVERLWARRLGGIR